MVRVKKPTPETTAQSLLSSLPPEVIELLRGLLEVGSGSSSPPPPDQGGESGGGDGTQGGGSSGGGAAGKIYRQRIYHLVPYGHFEEVLALCEQLNALARARGGTGGTLWIPTIGQQNELIVEFEFNSLAVFEQGRAATNSDPEWTGLVRKIGQAVVPGSVRTELVETAPHLA
jgi:hypothetical protein